MKTFLIPVMVTVLFILVIITAGTAQIEFTQHPVADGFDEPWSVFPADVDGDQDIDIVGSARLGHQVAWWENDGYQSFTMHLISSQSSYAMGTEAADMDNDGDIDVVCASQTNGVEMWENSGTQNFTRRILGSWPYASFLTTADIDGNGYIDVLVACCEGGINRMGWIENTNGNDFVDHIVASNWDHANSVCAGDVDADGDMDLLGTASGRSTGTGEIAWFENDGEQVFTKHSIYTTSARPSCAIARDLDLDGDVDVVATVCAVNQVMWFENDGNQEFTQRVIGYGFGRPHSVDTSDFDGDGDVDVAAGAINSDMIAWLENDGEQSFTQHVITAGFDGAADVFAADVDLDGDQDLLGTAHYADRISWWENSAPTGIGDETAPPLTRFTLNQNFPNPFNPRTTIRYHLPEDSRVVLKIYSLHGKEIRTLVDEEQTAGFRAVVWDGRDDTGRAVGSGVYFSRLKTDVPGARELRRKMLLTK